MDVYGHVNNVAMLRLMEEARIRFFATMGSSIATGDIIMFVAHQEIDYVKPLMYSHEPAVMSMSVTRTGGSGFDVGYRIFGADGSLSAVAETSLVVVDSDGRPTAIPDDVRAAFENVRGEPVPLRRRRVTAGAS